MIYIIGSLKYNTKPKFDMLPISGHPITWQNSPVRISKTTETEEHKILLTFLFLISPYNSQILENFENGGKRWKYACDKTLLDI